MRSEMLLWGGQLSKPAFERSRRGYPVERSPTVTRAPKANSDNSNRNDLTTPAARWIITRVPTRSTVGPLPLEQGIGVRIPGGQPDFTVCGILAATATATKNATCLPNT